MGHAPNRQLSGSFNGKTGFVGTYGLLYSVSLPEVFCGPQIRQKYGPAAGGAQVSRATTMKGRQLFEKNVHPRSFCPQCKILATRVCLQVSSSVESMLLPLTFHHSNTVLCARRCPLVISLRLEMDPRVH